LPRIKSYGGRLADFRFTELATERARWICCWFVSEIITPRRLKPRSVPELARQNGTSPRGDWLLGESSAGIGKFHFSLSPDLSIDTFSPFGFRMHPRARDRIDGRG